MKHVLIIEGNMAIGSILTKHLSKLGFDSFDHVWTEEDAVAIADARLPDLLLVGDGLDSGDPVEAARKICVKYNVPALLVTTDPLRARERLNDGAILEGPFAFSNIPAAVKAAAAEHPAVAAADRYLARV
ncbi:hypothetical protein [Parasphingorhabdus sp.]|uniref:hypothetical protein n=1 Tax=Parasphingorhabdus sp. TaxID=2709688 RepID=UPI003A92424F